MGSAPVSGVGFGVSPKRTFNCFMNPQTSILKPIPEREMSEWARIALRAHRRATRKKRIELRQRGLPMIIWKDGKVREVPA
jgi:hypothetical protein